MAMIGIMMRLFIVLGITANALSASVHVIIVKNSSEYCSHSSLDQSCCTSNSYTMCYQGLNEIEYDLSRFDSLSIHFEESSSTFFLHTILSFSSYTQLEFHGASSNETVIQCINRGSGVGMTFKEVSNFFAFNITFKNCGQNLIKTDHGNDGLQSALLFDNCSNIKLTSVTVQESTGFGITMFNVVGEVQFKHCSFRNNSANGTDSGGGGVYLEMTAKTLRGVYSLLSCSFMQNKAYTSTVYPKGKNIRAFGQGGGLLISLRGNASHHYFRLQNCIFINNSAVWGGGLHLFLTNSSYNNTIVVGNSLFKANRASAGGGGMVVYMVSSYSLISENNITIYKSNFTRNQAKGQGGGTILHAPISSSKAKHKSSTNCLKFEQCIWSFNAASHSAAVDVTTRRSVTESSPVVPVFSNCIFKEHQILPTITLSNSKGMRTGKGTFIVLKSIIKFENNITFKENAETALYSVSSKVEFVSKSSVIFSQNKGENGGAIALLGSFLSVGSYSRLYFIENKAFEFGGAIYSETQGINELHENIRGLNCFIHCNHCKTITILFADNRANSHENLSKRLSFGQAIFATSLLSCVSKQVDRNMNLSTVLQSIAINFVFNNSSPYDQIVTSAVYLGLSMKFETHIVPGKEFNVPLVTKDIFGHRIQSNYKAFIRHHNVAIDAQYIYMPSNKLKLYGDPGSECNITIERKGRDTFYLSVGITMAQCPPGYILKEIAHNISRHSGKKCVCGQHIANGEVTYKGISSCSNLFQANVRHHFWVGYESEDASPDNLLTAFCPHSFCSYNGSQYANEYLLPDVANKALLDKFICRNGRTGKICGRCQSNYSVFFHSPNYLCKKDKMCSLGWIFYLMSEVLPLTIIFAIVLSFNISFTSGGLNGFLFYAQIIDILCISAIKHKSNYPLWTILITKAAIFTYNFFNLNFFHLDTLSFCIWKGATTLSIIVLKYLTIVIAFLLVVGVFIIMNSCAFGNLKYYSKRLRLKQSVIHGISTFLVTCFAQTVKVTFHIFASGLVTKKGERVASYQVLYDGDVQLFSAEHIKYVVPGLLLFISVVVVPTSFLMCYPLGFNTLSKCGLSEAKVTKLHNYLCMIRLKPLLDSFQGCYKDQYRCFAGLYFIYRIAVLAAFSFSYGATDFYLVIQIQASIMLIVHCLTHPYKRKIHNALDTLLFSNVAIINGLSAFVYAKSKEPLYPLSVRIASALQMFLTGLPLIVLLLYTVLKIFLKVKMHRQKNRSEVAQSNTEDIPFRLLESGSDESFHPLENHTTN